MKKIFTWRNISVNILTGTLMKTGYHNIRIWEKRKGHAQLQARLHTQAYKLHIYTYVQAEAFFFVIWSSTWCGINETKGIRKEAGAAEGGRSGAELRERGWVRKEERGEGMGWGKRRRRRGGGEEGGVWVGLRKGQPANGRVGKWSREQRWRSRLQVFLLSLFPGFRSITSRGDVEGAS